MSGFTIQSTCSDALTLYANQRNIVVATFAKFLLKNIGGSENFEDKKCHFYRELKKVGATKTERKYTVKINRETIVKDVGP